MGFIFLLVLFVMALLIAAGWALISDDPDAKGIAAVIGIVSTILFVGISAMLSYNKIETGNVGVVYSFGSIQDETLSAGQHWIAPWKSVKTANIQTQRAQFENLPSFAAESQEVGITLTVNYELSADKAVSLYTNVGPDWFNKLVPSRVNQIVKDTTVKFNATELGPNRESVKNTIVERLNAALNRYSVTVVDVNIDNIKYSDAFTQSIEAKQQATQEALKAEAKVKQAEAEARQKIATSEGEAKSTIALAKGQAEANRIIAASITPEVIQSRQVDNQAAAIEKLDRLNPQAQVVYLPAGITGLGTVPVVKQP